MSNLIATIETKRIHIYDDIFDSEEEKELFINAPDEEKYQYIGNIYFNNQMYLDHEINIDLYE